MSKKFRQIVWETYMDNDKYKNPCFCCEKTMIDPFSYNFGYIISNINGGDINNIENIRPICSLCNLSIGTQNMYDYILDNFFWYQNISLEQVKMVANFLDIQNIDNDKVDKNNLIKLIINLECDTEDKREIKDMMLEYGHTQSEEILGQIIEKVDMRLKVAPTMEKIIALVREYTQLCDNGFTEKEIMDISLEIYENIPNKKELGLLFPFLDIFWEANSKKIRNNSLKKGIIVGKDKMAKFNVLFKLEYKNLTGIDTNFIAIDHPYNE